MKKFFLILLCLIAFFILAIGLTFFFRVNVISYGLSKTLNTPCAVKACNFTKNSVQIKGLVIQNPSGCQLKNALVVEQVDILLNWNNLFKTLTGSGTRKIVLDKIQIDHSLMGLELFTLTGSDTNWSRLLNTAEGPPSNEPPNTSTDIDIQINALILNDIRFNVQYNAIAKIPITPSPISRIELKNIGTNTDVNAKQLLFIIFKVLIEQAANGLNLKTLIPEMILERMLPITAPFFEINDATNFLKRFFQSSPDNNQNSD